MKKTVRAYGKLNLSLEITGILPNGYHTVSTVMQSVSLYNRVTVEKNKSGLITLSSDDKALPTDGRNTAFKAAEGFLKAAPLKGTAGLDIFIEKRVPYRAGMGSASADAAGVLAAANALFGRPLSRQRLSELALSVGADVPFCLLGGAALATGTGERLTALPPLPECAFLIYHPGRGISTPEAYRRFDALADPVQPDSLACFDAVTLGLLSDIAQSCGNVFEQCCDIDEVFEIKSALQRAGALAACMTGSGTAVFGLFKSLPAAEAARLAIARPDWRCWTAIPVNYGIEFE